MKYFPKKVSEYEFPPQTIRLFFSVVFRIKNYRCILGVRLFADLKFILELCLDGRIRSKEIVWKPLADDINASQNALNILSDPGPRTFTAF